jgi:ubiquinone/menaquinone biosynthesis C-methylase UbiE
MITALRQYEKRNSEQLRRHYEVEKELGCRMRAARPEERTTLYATVYDELFRRVPDHPQLLRIQDDHAVSRVVEDKLRLLRLFLKPETTFLEIGAGDCRLAMSVARQVKKVYALDVSAEITKNADLPPNCELVLSNGTNVPLAPNSIDLVYSYQLTEHLHEDDAADQLRNIWHVLRPGGSYICITPNRLNGPHDISRYFDRIACGLHLKEYTLTELERLFRLAQFSRVSVCTGTLGRYVQLSMPLVRLLEHALSIMPWKLQRWIGDAPVARNVLLGAMVGTK